jgi:hypothetical protein
MAFSDGVLCSVVTKGFWGTQKSEFVFLLIKEYQQKLTAYRCCCYIKVSRAQFLKIVAIHLWQHFQESQVQSHGIPCRIVVAYVAQGQVSVGHYRLSHITYHCNIATY